MQRELKKIPNVQQNRFRTVKKLLLPKQTLDYENLNRKVEYLNRLPVERYNAATPKILFGLNNINITVTNKIKEGAENEPVAIKQSTCTTQSTHL